MKEADVRRAIGLDTTLTTAQKYTLIMLLTRLDWETWTGVIAGVSRGESMRTVIPN